LSDIRVDKIVIPKLTVTKEGYLRGDAIVTRTGVFKYMNADGTTRLELRHPDDILKQDSLNTLKSIPVTNDHPKELVTTDNVDKLLVGMTGETVKLDGNSILTTLTITHKDAINIVNRGKQELSLGYKVDVIEEDGEYEGEKYTHRQTNVDYNHLAIVEVARAGRSARINLDGALIQVDNLKDNNEDSYMSEKEKEAVEETETKVEGEVVVEKVVEAEVNTDAEIKLDKALATIDQLKAENTKLKSINMDSMVEERVNARLFLLNKVSKVTKLDEKDILGKTDRNIMESVISRFDTDIKLDEKSDAYVEGRFDAIIEMNAGNGAIIRQLNNVKRTDSSTPKLNAIDILNSHHKKKA
jgi:hypothetical protein